MSEPLWQYEDYVRFTRHESADVRLWALERLKKYGTRAKEPVAALIEDENSLVRGVALRFLGDVGGAEDGPRLLQSFQASDGKRAAQYAAALGQVGYAPAVPVLLERLRRQPDSDELFGITGALARIGGEEAHAALRSLVQGARENNWATGAIVGELLRLQDPSDIPFVVNRYFELAPPEHDNRMLTEFERATNTEHLIQAFRYDCEGSLERMLEEAEAWGLAVRDRLSPTWVAALKGRSSRRDQEGTVRMIRTEALRVGQQRGFDLERATPSDLKELPSYQRLDLTRLRFIEAFASAMGQLSWRERRRRRRSLDPEVEFLFAVLMRLASTPDYQERLHAALDRTAALLEIICADREEVPEEWVAEVEALGPAAVPAMQKVLEEAPDSWGALRAAGVLEALAVSHPEACIPAIPALMKGLQEEGGDLVQERCMAALRRIGEPVLEEAARVLVKGDNTQKLYLMGVLEEIPVERSVDLLLKHYEELLEAWKEPTVEALKSLGSARAIEVLRPDALAGESLFEDALLLLCDLHGIQAKELAPLRARHAERTERLNRRLEALQSGLNLDALIAEDEKEEMRLELKCRECGRVYTYEVGKVTCCPDVDREGHKEQEFFFQRPIVCKNCGAEERYELAGHAYLMLTAELLKLTALAEEQGPGVSGTSRLQVVKNFGLVDGTRCTPHEAIDIYRQRIDREPRNPEHRFRFGNVLRFLGRTEEAQAQYEEAVRLDPTCLQAHFSLGTLAHEQGDRARMETHMKQVVALAPRSADPQRLDLALTARDLMAGRISKVEIGPAVVPPRGTPGPPPDASKRGQKKARRRQEQRQSRRAEPPARPAPPVPRFGKVGRNDPCPCGSGKKYKRCCGR